LSDKAPLAAGSGPEPTASSDQFIVKVANNWGPPDEEDYYTLGAYATLEAAITEAKLVVDKSLRRLLKPGMSAEALYKKYTGDGDDPYIRGSGIAPGTTAFSAWKYAKQRCEEICAEPAPPADQSRQGERKIGAAIHAWIKSALKLLGLGPLSPEQQMRLDALQYSKDEGPNTKPGESAKRPIPERPARSPEVEKRLAEFTAGIGPALVAKLNRNVLAEQSKENMKPGESAKRPTPERAERSPEVEKDLAEVKAKLGHALVDNLNRNVLKERGSEPKNKPEPSKKG
jgi:hypothetical protein